MSRKKLLLTSYVLTNRQRDIFGLIESANYPLRGTKNVLFIVFPDADERNRIT